MVSQAQHKYRQLHLQDIEENFNSEASLSVSPPLERKITASDPTHQQIPEETKNSILTQTLPQEVPKPSTALQNVANDIDNLLNNESVPEEDDFLEDEFVSKDIEQKEALAIQSIQDPAVRCQRATEAVLNKYQIEDMINDGDFILNAEQKEEIFLLFCDMKCSECPDKPAFKRFRELSEHSLMEHKSLCRVTCCDGVLRLRLTLERHIISKHLNPGTRKIKCDICKKLFHKRYISTHIKNHLSMQKREFKCKLCPSGFARKYTLLQHMNTIHLSEEEHCDICNKLVKNLPSHRKKHRKKGPVKTLLCSECGKELKLGNFNTHMKFCHGEPNEKKKAKCPKCDIVMISTSLRHHLRRAHSGKNQMKQCPLCPGKMVAYLNVHMKAAHGEKKYSCVVCPKKFNNKISLEDHISSDHTGIPRHSCEFCGRTFNRNGNYFKHRKRMHSAQIAEKKLEEMKKIQSEDIPVYDPVKKEKRKSRIVGKSDVEKALQELQTIIKIKNTTVTDHNDDGT